MTYLSAEWEKQALMKMEAADLDLEMAYLYDQYVNKIKLLKEFGWDLYCKIEPKLTFEMLKDDLELTVEQLQRINEEYRRRELP